MENYQTIVAGTDFSPLSKLAVDAAIDLADRFGTQRLHLVHVVGASHASTILPYTYTEQERAGVRDRAIEIARERLDTLELPSHKVEITTEVRIGTPAQELARAADEVGGRLIIVSGHGYGGIRRLMLGSVASTVVRIAHCPVLIVGKDRPGTGRFENILAAVDLSKASAKVLSHTFAFAAKDGAAVKALSLHEHPVVATGESGMLPRYLSPDEIEKVGRQQEEAVESLIEQVPHEGIEVSIEVMDKSPPSLVILDVAPQFGSDLIVLGTSGHNAWSRMILGSTATRVMADAQVPVLVVPHDAND